MKSARSRALVIAAAGAGLLLLAFLGYVASGLSATGSPNTPARQARQQPPPPTTRAPDPAVVHFSVANLAVDVRPDVPVTVSVSSGTLGAVTLMDGQGGTVHGQARPGGGWESTSLLHLSTAYTLAAVATGPDGTSRSTISTFRTLTPKVSATYSLTPSGGTVGVGMPVIIAFDSPVDTKARRVEVERRASLRTVPAQVGSWGWLDDRQLMWRPESYWIPGTKVTVSCSLHGVQTGDKKWVAADTSTSFSVGPAMVSSVDTAAHSMRVRRNGALIATFPVSTGRAGPLTETRSGIKVIISREPTIVMDSATIGIPLGSAGYYKITTQWDLRLTWTGEFIHSAPWSVGSQGNTNVSHGCTNMAPADALWMFTNSHVGDVVVFTGSSRVFTPQEGIGVWVYDFSGWKARSALA